MHCLKRKGVCGHTEKMKRHQEVYKWTTNKKGQHKPKADTIHNSEPPEFLHETGLLFLRTVEVLLGLAVGWTRSVH